MSWTRSKKSSKQTLKWKHVDRACDHICDMLRTNTPDHVVALARGGLAPASMIANRLGIRHVYSMGIASYKPGENHETRDTFDVYQSITINNPRFNASDRVLVVDDISDRGDTFNHVCQMLMKQHAVQIRTAALVIKPETAHTPDYFHITVPQDCWVTFPWER